MNCRCIIQSGINKGSECGRRLKDMDVCGFHKRTCVLGGRSPTPSARPKKVARPIAPLRVRDPTVRAKPARVPSPPSPSPPSPSVGPIPTSKVERFIKKSIDALSDEDVLIATLKQVKEIVERKYKGEFKYKIDYTKEFIVDSIRARMIRSARRHLGTIVYSHKMESLTVGKLKNLMAQKYGKLLDYSDYKEYIGELISKKAEIFNSDACKKCRTSLKVLLD